MKRILLTSLFLLIASNAHATVFTASCAGACNWSANATWGGAGHPVAGDTANIGAGNTGTITIDAASAAAIVDMTGNAGTVSCGSTFTLTVTGGVTLGGTVTGSNCTLALTAAQTITSNSITWPGKTTFSVAGNITMVGNWISTNLCTFTAATNVNKTTAETLTCNGGLTMTSATGTTPTATIILGGGIWSGNTKIMNNLTIAGAVTVSGSVAYQTGTITYSSGAVTTTSSTITFTTPVSIDTSGMNWNNVSLSTGTYTLLSNLNMTGTLSGGGNTIAMVFSGAFNITCATLSMNASFAANTLTIPAGQTLTVTTAMNWMADTLPSGTFELKSGTASSSIFLNYTGSAATENVYQIKFTDVDASGSSRPIYNYFGSTLTRTTNIINTNPSNVGTGFVTL